MKKFFYRLYCRTFQKTLYIVSPFMPYKKQRIITGEKSVLTLPSLIKEAGKNKICIISDAHVIDLPIVKELISLLKKEKIGYSIFDKVPPNPTVEVIEDAKNFFLEQECDSLVAIGGGSSIDSAKAVGARVAYPKKSLHKMKGILKVNRAIPFLIAVPSTAGTGSEATLAAVVTDPSIKEKYAINSFPLIPKIAILDPEMTRTLPPHLTSTTAMDALTHAIEAFIGLSSTAYSRKASVDATTIIFHEIEKVYKDPLNTTSRQHLLLASYRAGEAFTRSYVGNIHALSHPLTAYYGIPHGLANAVTLPYVLSYYGKKCHKRLATLARDAKVIELGKSDEESANLFIQKIEDLNKKLDIPTHFTQIREEDIDNLTKHALGEANPLYPVPVIFTAEDCKNLYHKIMNI